MESQKYSKYLPIWNALKQSGECKITAPPIYHKRIIKAVKKRRDKDLAFLYQLHEGNYSHMIRFKIEGTVITFTLQRYLSIRGL